MLAVVMQHCVIERIDAAKIFGIECMLRADFMRRFSAQIRMEQVQHRSQNRETGKAQRAAFLFQPLHQVLLQKRVEDDPGRLFDFCENPVKLLLRPHQRVNVLDRHDLGVLRRGGSRHCD